MSTVTHTTSVSRSEWNAIKKFIYSLKYDQKFKDRLFFGINGEILYSKIYGLPLSLRSTPDEGYDFNHHNIPVDIKCFRVSSVTLPHDFFSANQNQIHYSKCEAFVVYKNLQIDDGGEGDVIISAEFLGYLIPDEIPSHIVQYTKWEGRNCYIKEDNFGLLTFYKDLHSVYLKISSL